MVIISTDILLLIRYILSQLFILLQQWSKILHIHKFLKQKSYSLVILMAWNNFLNSQIVIEISLE